MNFENLTKKLGAWRVEPGMQASFQREVWQRIAARQAARHESFLRQALEWLANAFVRPASAIAMATVFLAAGLGIAHEQAHQANARDWEKLETRYAKSVSPFLHQAADVAAVP